MKMYKETYNNYIKNQEELLEKTKKAIEADNIIKTKFVHEDNSDSYTNKIKARFKRQRHAIEERERLKYGSN